jgi:hypothetical protein
LKFLEGTGLREGPKFLEASKCRSFTYVKNCWDFLPVFKDAMKTGCL